MHAIRIYIIASHPLFAQGVSSLLEAQPDIQVAGLSEYSQNALREIEALKPDVVIVDSEQSTRGQIEDALLSKIPGLKLVGLSLEEDNITVTYLQQKTGAAVEDLIAAVRSLPDSWLPLQRQMRILATIQGTFGQRVVEHLRQHAPAHWNISVWRFPPLMPPEQASLARLLPRTLPAADLVLGLGESPQMAYLLPEVVARSGARAMLAPVESWKWFPKDALHFLQAKMEEMGVAAAFPRPFCSLTMRTYNEASWRVVYQDAHIAEFARYFGRLELRILYDEGEHVTRCEVRRDVACGFGQRLSGRLVGCAIGEVEDVASQAIREHYCPNGGILDPDYKSSLRHVAELIVKDAVRREVAPFLRPEDSENADQTVQTVPSSV